jgi:hypothetical protein
MHRKLWLCDPANFQAAWQPYHQALVNRFAAIAD